MKENPNVYVLSLEYFSSLDYSLQFAPIGPTFNLFLLSVYLYSPDSFSVIALYIKAESR